MCRVLTVELTTGEALTVHLMMRLTGITPDRIVQRLHKTPIFATIVTLTTGHLEEPHH